MKLLIITGGSTGLGLELVNLYQQAGWQVIEFSRSGQSTAHHPLDLAQPAQIPGLLEPLVMAEANSDYDELLFINNAGSLDPIRRADQLTASEIQQSLHINLTSPLLLISDYLRLFRHAPCRKTLVNISSGAASKGYPGWSLYCTAKAGIENYMRTLFLEEQGASEPFRIINFDPYVMDTDMQAKIRSASEEHFPQRARFIEYHQNGKLLSASLVARTLQQLVTRDDLSAERYAVISLLAETEHS